MRDELKLIETIESYLEGTMTSGERSEFEQQMASDPTIQREMELQEVIVNHHKEEAFRNEVKRYRERQKALYRLLKYLLVALLFFAMGAAAMSAFNESESNGTSSDYSKTSNDLATVRNENENANKGGNSSTSNKGVGVKEENDEAGNATSAALPDSTNWEQETGEVTSETDTSSTQILQKEEENVPKENANSGKRTKVSLLHIGDRFVAFNQKKRIDFKLTGKEGEVTVDYQVVIKNARDAEVTLVAPDGTKTHIVNEHNARNDKVQGKHVFDSKKGRWYIELHAAGTGHVDISVEYFKKK